MIKSETEKQRKEIKSSNPSLGRIRMFNKFYKNGWSRLESLDMLSVRVGKDGLIVRYFTDWSPLSPVNTEGTVQIYWEDFKKGRDVLWKKTLPYKEEKKLLDEAFTKAEEILSNEM